MGWGSSTRRGGGRKLRARPRNFVFLGFRREESGMKVCAKKLRAHFSFPNCTGEPSPGHIRCREALLIRKGKAA